MLNVILLACFFTLLVSSSKTKAQSYSAIHSEIRPIPSYPESSIKDVEGAWSDCEPPPLHFPPVESQFANMASQHALQRIIEIDHLVNNVIEIRATLLYGYTARWWHKSSQKYKRFAKAIDSYLESTWRNYDKDRQLTLEMVPALSEALQVLGSEIDECLSLITPNTTASPSCLEDLVEPVKSDAVVGQGPTWEQVGPELALPYYELWVVEHATLSMVNVGIQMKVVQRRCEEFWDSTEECADALTKMRNSVKTFAESIPPQIERMWREVQRIFPTPAPSWSFNESLPSAESSDCAGVLYGNNSQGAICPGRQPSEFYCDYLFDSEALHCKVVTFQYEVPYDKATYMCAAVLGRIQSNHTDPYRYGVARDYYHTMTGMVKPLQEIHRRVAGWVRHLYPPNAAPPTETNDA